MLVTNAFLNLNNFRCSPEKFLKFWDHKGCLILQPCIQYQVSQEILAEVINDFVSKK
jgi:hypothetical protein